METRVSDISTGLQSHCLTTYPPFLTMTKKKGKAQATFLVIRAFTKDEEFPKKFSQHIGTSEYTSLSYLVEIQWLLKIVSIDLKDAHLSVPVTQTEAHDGPLGWV